MLHILATLLCIRSALGLVGFPNENIFFDGSSSYIFALHSKKSIDCSQGSSRVQQYSFHGTHALNQQFKITYKSSEYSGLSPSFYYYWYTLQCKDDNDYWTRNGNDDIEHKSLQGGDDGLFMFDYLDQPALFQVINKRNDKCLDVPGDSTANSKQLQVYPCHSRSNQKYIIIPKQEYRCPFAVISPDIAVGSGGRYFNYWDSTVRYILSPSSFPPWDTYKVYNYRTMEIRKVRMWNNGNSACAGVADACGRVETYSNSQHHDWEAGDVLTFVGESVSCGPSSSQIVTCPFAVLAIDHTNGKDGGYFRFDIDQVNEILGYTMPSTAYLTIRNLRDNSLRNVVMWRDNNGGAIITDSYGIPRNIGHGRINPLPSNYNYWRVGDVLMFYGITTKCIEKFVSNYDVDPLPSPINDEPIENIIKDNKYIFGSIAGLFIVMFVCLVYFWYKQCCTFRKKPKYEPVKIIDSESEAEMVEINK